MQEKSQRRITERYQVPILSKAETQTFSQRSYARGISLFVVDILLYVGATAGTLLFPQDWLKVVCAIFAAFCTALLFIVGHDACHQSLTPNKRLNYWIGQIAFLPSLHPFSLWDLGHNKIHHRFTNLKGWDPVWTPLSLQEYRSLPRFQRLLYRYYRGVLGPTIYYLYEIWWKKMFIPHPRAIKYKSIYIRDIAIVSIYLLLVIWLLWQLPSLLTEKFGVTHLSWWEPLTYTLLIPFFIWNMLMALVIYLHHTHPEIVWFGDKDDWDAKRAQLECTVHVIFPGPLNYFFHNIMEHTAHHVRASIPLYHLQEAQHRLEEVHGERIVNSKWSMKNHMNNIAKCKLYDFTRSCWLDFDGNPTTAPKR